jgi:hypothetical protein
MLVAMLTLEMNVLGRLHLEIISSSFLSSALYESY